MHRKFTDVTYPAGMPERFSPDALGSDPSESPLTRFARVVRTAREQRKWTQEELADQAGVSRPTVQRYEGGRTTPQPAEARKVFRALGLDTRLIPILLGYVTPEEMGTPVEVRQLLTPTEEEALRILQDPTVPAAAKAEWLQFLKFRHAQMATADSRAEIDPPKAG